MYMHPWIGSELARERQRDLLAQAHQHRLVHELREHARASRRAERAERRLRRALRAARRTAAADASPAMTSRAARLAGVAVRDALTRHGVPVLDGDGQPEAACPQGDRADVPALASAAADRGARAS